MYLLELVVISTGKILFMMIQFCFAFFIYLFLLLIFLTCHCIHLHRMVSETCFEGEGSHWASSAFHTYDAGRHKSGPKSIGKHKASSESGRPPKSKIQRTTEPQEVPVTNNFHRIPGQLLHNSAEFHITQSLSDLGISDSEFTYFDNLPQEAETEFVPYQYDSDVLSGIEELDPLTDFTDIG